MYKEGVLTMYDEDEDIADVDIAFRFADSGEVELDGIPIISTEKVVEHNLSFDMTVLRETQNNVKKKVDSVEKNVKGVAYKVDDVEGKVIQAVNELANLKATVETLGVKKAASESSDNFEVVDDTLFSGQDILALEGKYEQIQKEEIIEDFKKESKGSVQHGKRRKEKGENVVVSSFKDGALSVISLLAKILGILSVPFLIYIGNLLINPTAIVPDNLVLLVDVIRIVWDAVLNFVAWLFKWLMEVINYIKK